MKISIIAALSVESGIGKGGALLWRIPEDMQEFKRRTMGHPIIMGRRTFESIPYRPLSGRQNIVITRNSIWGCEGAIAVSSLEEALQEAEQYNDEAFVIGGAEVFKDALPYAQKLYLTFVGAWKRADVYFPEFRNGFKQIESCFRIWKNGNEEINLRFITFVRQ